MNADKLVNDALLAIWPETREPKRTKEIADHRRSRYADMTLTAAAEILLTDGRTGGSAEALHTAALERAGVKPAQFARLAPWAQERVVQAIGQMLTMIGAAEKPRRGRPPKAASAMSGAERQRVLQERRKAAEAALTEIRKHVDFALRENPPPHERRLLTRMQEIDRILKRLLA